MEADPEFPETFPWTATGELLGRLLERWELVADERGRSFVGRAQPGLRFTPPPLQAIGPETRDPRVYLDRLESGTGLVLVLLVQAGASALGLWRDGELLAHKVVKKYVVRGRGRAQPLHLKTRGKSRYGARLRLQGARAQLVETNEKLAEWRGRHGRFDQVFYSAPVRTWPELFRVAPRRSKGGRGLPVRIPLDVRVPCHAELLRVWRFLGRGSLARPRPDELPDELIG